MKTIDFDAAFDAEHSVDEAIDYSKAVRPNVITKRVNVDFPAWVVEKLDKEAQLLGVTRQSLIKIWIADCKRNVIMSQSAT